jgi:hypothetical protein
LLEQRAAHAEAPVVHRPSTPGELRNHVLDGVVVHAVALNEANLRRDHFPAFGIDLKSKFLRGDVEKLLEHGDGLATVRPDDQRSVALHDFFAELATP